jgi:hypothetical protein
MENTCHRFWDESDYLPFDAILNSWCEGSNEMCREAKKHAIIAGCEKGKIKYIRNDGKSFNDPVNELYGKKILLIHRESFLEWSKNLDNSYKLDVLNPNEKRTLLKMVYTMAVRGYAYNAADKKSKVTSEIVNDAAELNLKIDDDTVRKWLKQSAELCNNPVNKW